GRGDPLVGPARRGVSRGRRGIVPRPRAPRAPPRALRRARTLPHGGRAPGVRPRRSRGGAVALLALCPHAGTLRPAAGSAGRQRGGVGARGRTRAGERALRLARPGPRGSGRGARDRKSTRLNSSHEWISYAVFCLKKKNT